MSERPSDRTEALFYEAVELPPEEQNALLEAACAADPDLRARVEKLLADDARLRTGNDTAALLNSPLVRDRAAPATVPMSGGGRALWPQIERYRILRVLGEGGMGTVYEAEQQNPRRPVALKVIRPGLVSQAVLKRFAQEAQILGRLHHPGIARIYEAGVTDDGQSFFAMELIAGATLDQYARLGALTLPARLELVARVCDAVQHAHDQGIIHRDLKPSNILVDESGQPRVLDFGVARSTDPDLLTSAYQTRTGHLVGTLVYMSPEQVAADPAGLDRRSDVYTLGVILFELLAGRLPYALENLPLPEAARVIREEEPARLGSIDVHCRGDVETIVARALEKDRARRYPSAAELAEDLRRHLRHEPIRARPVGAAERLWSWARRRPALATAYALAALVLFLGLGGGLAVWSWQAAEAARAEAERAREAKEVARDEADQLLYLNLVQLAQREWLAGDVARARKLLDGCAAGRWHWEWHYLARLGRPLVELSEPPEGSIITLRAPISVQFSPDGRRLLSAGNAGLLRLFDSETGKEVATLEGAAIQGPEGGPPVRLAQREPINAVFSADGKEIASPGWGEQVSIWDGGTGKHLRNLSRQGVAGLSSLAFSHDGRHLALGTGVSRVNDPRLHVWDAGTGREVFSLAGHKANVSAVAYSADGRWLASGSHDHTVKLWDAATGQAVRTLEGHTDLVNAVAFHPDSRRLASAGDDGTVRVWNVDGSLLLMLTGHGGSVHSLTFRPDGKLLAAGMRNGVVMLWEETGKEAFPLRGHLGKLTTPTNQSFRGVSGLSFSPDGKRLASSSMGETVKVWDATGPQEVRSIPLALKGTSAFALSGDGRRLVEGRDTGEVLVWEVGAQPRALTLRGHTGEVKAVALSPDERRIATVGADLSLRLWDAQTGAPLRQWQAHEGAALAVAFSADGQLVATGGGSQERGEVKVWDGDGRLLLSANDSVGNVFSVAFSPDRRWLVSGAGGGRNGTVKMRNAQSGEVLWEQTQPTWAPSARLAFSPDGRRVASGDGWSAVRLWDAATGEELRALTGSDKGGVGVRFSPDGRRLVSCGIEGTVMMWDVATGVEALRLKGGYGEVWFSADGSRLFSVGWPTPAVMVWESAPAADPS